MSDFEVGSTAPPFHPWCRCCTAPYFEDMEGLGKRAARDVVTGEGYEVPADMTYPEWKKLQDAKYGEGTVDAQRSMEYNKSADRRQYERYKDRLGDAAPSSFREFQEMKYTDTERYSELTGYYAYKGRVPEATAHDYRVYRAVTDTGIYGTVRVPPETIDPSSLPLDTEHVIAHGHSATEDEARGFIHKALFSIRRTHQSGKHFVNYYSKAGAAYVDVDSQVITTAFKEEQYDGKTNRAVEAAAKA